MKLVTYISGYLWFCKKSDKVGILLAVLFSVLVMLYNTCCPLYFKYMIELLSNNIEKSSIILFGISFGYGLLWVFGHLFGRLKSIMARRTVLRCTSLMTEDLYKQLLRSHSQKQSCDNLGLIERVNRDMPELIDGFLWHIAPIFLEIVVACVVVVKMTDIYIAAMLLITIIFYFAHLTTSFKKVTNYQRVANKGQMNFLSRIVDSFSNIEIVKLFNGYLIEETRTGTVMSEKETALYNTQVQVERLGSVQFLIVGAGLMIITCMLTKRIVDFRLLISDLVLVHTYLLQLTLPLGYFGFVVASLQRGMATFCEIENIKNNIKLYEASYIKKATQYSADQAPSLRFESVYVENNGVKILDNISLTIPAGKVTGITGLSGNGKTSLLRMITKQLPMTAGNLYFDQKEIREISTADIINMVSVVPQEVRIFNDTILSNILYGCNVTSHIEKLKNILEMTNLSELINRLPKGIDTVIGNEHVFLSKGELQRITIARCLMRDANIYIFDEPTASLDIKNEQDIMEKILSYLSGKTLIIVTHRLSLLKKVDNVVLMSKCKIHESEFDVAGLSEECLYKALKPHDNIAPHYKGSVIF